jgi:CheY-like chemotaxis protein
MSSTLVKLETRRELNQLCAKLTQAMGETLGSLIGRDFSAQPGEFEQTDSAALLSFLPCAHAVVRGTLDKDYAGRKLLVLFEIQDAIGMSGLLMMSPEHVIEEHRQHGKLEGEDLEAFGEIGNVLCSGLGNVLRDAVQNIDIRLLDTGVVAKELDQQNLLPDGPLVIQSIKIRIGKFKESVAILVMDKASAETWNKAALQPLAEPSLAAKAPKQDPEPPTFCEDSLEDIVAVPIRGQLHAYVAGNDAMRVLRRCCRRVGFELFKHGPSEIPNPAMHKGCFVLLDIPLNDPRRLEWCRRIKNYEPTTKVLLLIHRPSRDRVKLAFLSGADLILGLPVEELQLCQRLTTLLTL